jgi:hypothetical protein
VPRLLSGRQGERQSNKSPMWARISAGVRVTGATRNAANDAGASRIALPPR